MVVDGMNRIYSIRIGLSRESGSIKDRHLHGQVPICKPRAMLLLVKQPIAEIINE